MSISDNKLWNLMIAKNMSKTKLRTFADIISNAMAKLDKNKLVQLDTLVNICEVPGCDIGDICEIILDE